MKNIKVLGSGCARCNKLETLVRRAVEETGTDAEIEKIEDIREITPYNVMSTPALVIDEEVKVTGTVPSLDELKKLITS